VFDSLEKQAECQTVREPPLIPASTPRLSPLFLVYSMDKEIAPGLVAATIFGDRSVFEPRDCPGIDSFLGKVA
jgi:hypothetical protein